MCSDKEIDRLVANHDKDPKGTARDLQSLDSAGVPADQLSVYSWLLNHVLGQLSASWGDAYARQRQIAARHDAPAVVFRNYAVAAFYTGHPLDAWAAQAQFAALNKLSSAEAETTVQLTALQYASPSEAEDASFLAVLHSAIEQTKSWGPGDSSKAAAAALNGLVSSWLERPVVEPAQKEAIQLAARRSHELWTVAGTWLHVERGWYLRTLVASHLSLWEQGRDAALAGLDVIEKNGEEDVDRAFFYLELARAYKGLSQPREQESAREKAVAISKTFSEPGLDEWFESKLKGT